MHSTGVSNLVFLGGSCNPTTWRTEVAIPYFRQAQVNFYNPQVQTWRPELIEEENRAKSDAGILLFVIDNQTRGVSALIELAELVAGNRILVCVLKEFIRPDSRICGQMIGVKEYQELRHAQLVIKCLMERRGVPVFSNLPEALGYCANLIKQQLSTDELIRRFTHAYQQGLLKHPIKLVRLREIFRSLDVANVGEIRMYDVQYAYRLITGCSIDEQTIRMVIFYQLRCSDNYVMSENNNDLRLNFEQFCCLIAIHEHQREAMLASRGQDAKLAPESPLLINKMSTLGHSKHHLSSSSNKHQNAHNSMIMRPLQWIFDWFSGVGAASVLTRHDEHLLNSSAYGQDPIIPTSKFGSNRGGGGDQVDGMIPRSRTSVQRLDSVQSLYSNNNNYLLGDIVSQKDNQRVPLVTGGGITSSTASPYMTAINTTYSDLASMRHVYPFQVECRDVYLGGTGLPSRWREEIAIPILRLVSFTHFFAFQSSFY